MSITQEELSQQLLKLLVQANTALPSGAGPGGQSSSSSGLAEDISSSTAKTVETILHTFDKIQGDNASLAEEILHCYHQINIATETSALVARCDTVSQAIHTLMIEVGQAVNSSFSIFIKEMDFSFSPRGSVGQDSDKVFFESHNDKTVSEAKAFYERNQTALLGLSQKDQDSQITMIDYSDGLDPDYEGRGNVLGLRLRPMDSSEDVGMLIFVRDYDQEPFVASEVNLADTLIKLGRVVLSNIMYAQKIHQAYLQTITSLVRAMEEKDAYTSGHSNRVSEYACELGRRLGLPDDEIEILEWAGLLHDIGKIGIRDDVLCKPGKLTDEEFEHIKTHPVKSFHVLEPIDALHCILGAARHHHEHYDGQGYPDELAGEAIPLHARIVQVADVWDALTSTRSYRNAMPKEKAKQILRDEAGTTMDPHLVKVFLKILDEQDRE